VIKLNLGCGSKKLPGFVNVDAQPMEDPDVVVRLDTDRWPWNDNSVEAVEASHVIEHIAPVEPFFHFMRELHRVCANGARVHITLPHPSHDIFLQDPTHQHAILPGTLAMFSKKYAEMLAKHGHQLTPFWKYFNIDFDMGPVRYTFDPAVDGSDPDLEYKARHCRNIIKEWETTMVVCKS